MIKNQVNTLLSTKTLALLLVTAVCLNSAAQIAKTSTELKTEMNAAANAGDYDTAARLKGEVKQAEEQEAVAKQQEEDKQILIFQRNYQAVMNMESTAKGATAQKNRETPAEAKSLVTAMDNALTAVTGLIAPVEKNVQPEETNAAVTETNVATSVSGNATRDTPAVPISGTGLTVNSVLTPNSDGINDFLVFSGLEIISPKNRLNIENSDDSTIYSYSNYGNDWNGTSVYWLSLTVFPAGTYTYELKLTGAVKGLYNGSFEIVR